MSISLPDGWSLWWPVERGSREQWLARRAGERGWFEATLLRRHEAYDDLRWDERVRAVTDRSRAAPHPALPRVRARYALDEFSAVIVERVAGIDLDVLLQRARAAAAPLPCAEAARIVACAASAVAALGRDARYVHGALDAASLRVRPDGSAALLDPWPVALSGRANVTGRAAYAPRFASMPPEAIKGLALDARSDVYSLGLMLYEAVTGARPFDAPSDVERMRRIVDSAPLAPPRDFAPSLPPALDAVIQRAVSKRPDERYASVAALDEALAPWAAAAPLPGGPARAFDRYATRVERTVARLGGDLSSRDEAARRALWRELRNDLREALTRDRCEVAEVIAITELRDAAADDLRALRGAVSSSVGPSRLLHRLATDDLAEPAPPRRVRLGAVEVETCPRAWASLSPLPRADQRYCAACDERVTRVEGVEGLALAAGRSCVSLRGLEGEPPR